MEEVIQQLRVLTDQNHALQMRMEQAEAEVLRQSIKRAVVTSDLGVERVTEDT